MQNDRNDTFPVTTVHAHTHTCTRNALMGGNVISVILGKFIGEPRRFTVTTKPKRASAAHSRRSAPNVGSSAHNRLSVEGC